jgi:F-type H+-transporting ATPase subunit b
MTIDWWTLGFQTVNVAVLIWLLGHFFWKPVANMIEARRASTQKLTGDAEAAQAAAATALAEVEKTRAGFAKEREAIIAAAHTAADAVQKARLAEAKSDAEAIVAAAKADVAKDAKAQDGVWAKRSTALAIDMAARLAARLDGAAVQARFLEWLLDEIRNLAEPVRKAAGAPDIKLKLTSAVKLDTKAKTTYGKLIAKAFGSTPHIAFRTDAKLIAGFELRGEHLVVNSSWRADLTAIEADLIGEKAQ